MRIIDPLTIPAYVTTLAFASFIILAVVLTDFTYDAAEMNRPVFALAFMIVASAWLSRRGLKIGSAIEGIALFASVSFAAPFCAVILASLDFPLTDATLAELDRPLLLGFQRQDIILALTRYPIIFDTLRMIYESIATQPWILLPLLWATGRETRGWVLVSAWAITVAVTLMIFTFVPAMGAPPYFLDYMDTLRHARDGSLRTLGTQVLAGIITFPSFHAAAAVLLAWGFAPIPLIGRPLVVWNVLMFASAFLASHYLVDLIAGGLIGGASIWASQHVLAWLIAKAGARHSAPVDERPLLSAPEGG